MQEGTEILLNAKTAEGRRLLPGLKVGEGFMRHPFDEEFGVRTSGLVAGRHLKSGHRHDRHATAYYGVAPSVFKALMKRWQKSRPGLALEEVSFLDVGAGMGRALLLAAELPFRQVVGVELNPTLTRIAKKNLTIWRASGRARAPMRVVCGDAVEFPLPPGPCLAFMFNPFGATVMRRLLKSWSKELTARVGSLDSHPSRKDKGAARVGHPQLIGKVEHPTVQGLDLIYVNHEQEHVLEQQAGFTRLFLGKVARSKADAIADHRILANQPDGEYASSNYEDCSMWRWVKTGK
ncbi:MAG: class I SAM-dependent methyltransferase [Terracidiphilus sp.]